MAKKYGGGFSEFRRDYTSDTSRIDQLEGTDLRKWGVPRSRIDLETEDSDLTREMIASLDSRAGVQDLRNQAIVLKRDLPGLDSGSNAIIDEIENQEEADPSFKKTLHDTIESNRALVGRSEGEAVVKEGDEPTPVTPDRVDQVQTSSPDLIGNSYMRLAKSQVVYLRNSINTFVENNRIIRESIGDLEKQKEQLEIRIKKLSTKLVEQIDEGEEMKLLSEMRKSKRELSSIPGHIEMLNKFIDHNNSVIRSLEAQVLSITSSTSSGLSGSGSGASSSSGGGSDS